MIGILHPQYLYFIPAVALVLFIILKLDFLRSKDDDFRRKDRRRMKVVIFISRFLVVSLLLAALAAPFIELSIQHQGPPKLTILVDKSRSMDIMGFDDAAFKKSLEAKIPVKVATIGRNTTSNLGEGILANLESDGNILLVSDGYSNAGLTLGDVALRAVSINTTISALDLSPVHDDASVIILGDAKAFTDVDYPFEVDFLATKKAGHPLRVMLDDKVIYDQKATEDKIFFKQKLAAGVHTITAQITEDDAFRQNNIYYKTVKVVPKPKVLFVSEKQNDPLGSVLDQLYAAEHMASLPQDLSGYYAVVLNDIPAGKADALGLTNYLLDGGGLLVVGGFSSFDRGSYKNSLLETLLPVKVGAAEKKRGNANIVIVIDISGASDIIYNGKRISPLDVTKALAINVVDTLNLANRVGVVAFNDKPYRVEDLAPLYNNKKSIDDKVKRLQGGGQSFFDVGLKGAYEMLKNSQGDRTIIILTDGEAFKDVQDRTGAVVDSLHSLGITTYVVGVGRNVQEPFLEDLAGRGGGIYFPASESNRLTILFGEPEKEEQGMPFSLVILNPSHFVTRGVSVNAVMTGFNEVVPKTAARMLVTTTSGRPALSVWNYGVGRVASINAFTGGDLGDMARENNSFLIARTVNWLIGDPEGKEPYVVMVDDGYVNIPFTITVKSDKLPEAQGHEFFKKEQGIYTSEKFSVTTPGYAEILGQKFAVNSEKEYAFVGMNPNLPSIVAVTGGKVFKPQDTDQIVDFVKNASRKTETEKVFFTWPFLIAALILLLIEIFIRKRQENLKEKKE